MAALYSLPLLTSGGSLGRGPRADAASVFPVIRDCPRNFRGRGGKDAWLAEPEPVRPGNASGDALPGEVRRECRLDPCLLCSRADTSTGKTLVTDERKATMFRFGVRLCSCWRRRVSLVGTGERAVDRASRNHVFRGQLENSTEPLTQHGACC